MSQILRTTRRLPKETLQYEAFTGMDGQGMPTYASAVDFSANVLEYDAGAQGRGAEFITIPDGSRVATPLTLYVQGDSAVVPQEQGRVTLDSDRYFIVVEQKTVSGLRYTRGAPDHYRLRCRVE